jgi:hypothetical protein
MIGASTDKASFSVAQGDPRGHIRPRRISRELLAHLHRDHPIEGAIIEKLIEKGEWIVVEGGNA